MSRSENRMPVIFRCTCCGAGIYDGDATEYQGDLYCPKCVDELFADRGEGDE